MNILTRSNCARYVEFRAVNKIYIQMNGKIEQVRKLPVVSSKCFSYIPHTHTHTRTHTHTHTQVPCSRSDVFSSKSVSMMEKRKMMKFLTFCSEFEKYPEEYEGRATMYTDACTLGIHVM